MIREYSRKPVELCLEELQRKYCEMKMSIAGVALDLGVSYSTVRRRLERLGLLRAHAEAAKLAAPKIASALLGKPRNFKPEHIERMRTLYKLRKNVLAPVGKRVNTKGYYDFSAGENMFQLEHRAIMEQHLGRKLGKDEVVHHKDHNKLNNSIENLQVMTRSEHTALHRQLEKKAREQQ